MRVRIVESVDIGEDHHEVGIDQAGYERRERVVIAETYLLDRHRIVLVHDRYDIEFEQARQRIASMEVRASIGRIAPG